ncbi:MAG TPA: RdgB/HAM1 family non-canonical purine NTP pyrophosphatase [Anaeromyxobacteraceae bacterium]|nr:RdgB/HAM1 family non-canonical purine NTP pyrophosphatase [Anaeromyxobacteraceae bacterium]
MDLFFGTTNPGKLRELRRLVVGLPLRVLSPEELGRPLPEVEEDGVTFRQNAEKKASAYARLTGLPALADDSGLCVDALAGAPGVHSARWSAMDDGFSSPACAMAEAGPRELGPELTRAARDEANNDKLLRVLEGVPENLRGAAYVAVLALARPDGAIAAQVEGTCRGRIGRARRGGGGFGYDPLFVPDGQGGRTMAELDAAEKDAISHRGAAFRALRPALERLAFDKGGV